MITAVFTDKSDYARATGLWQWDYGQRLRIEGLKLPAAVEIHFALTEQSGDAIPRVGTTKDGVTEVVIPDSLLENQAAGATYEIYAWIYLADKTSGETIKRISMQVKRRAKPEGHDTPEDAELFREAIEAVNASADRAEAAREGAEAAQKAAEEAANKIESEISGSEELAKQVKKDAEAVAKDKQAVSQLATETAKNAQNAAKSAQAAERSGTAAESAKAGAESAMKEVERDRVEVSETHKAVEQLREAVDTDRQAVAAGRRAVENTALQFGQFAQSAINAVGQAQEAAVQAVSAEGQKQTTAMQQAGTQAVSDVTAAKTEAVQAVTTEGDTQTKRVQDAAAGIVADREQIAANKAGIEALSQKKADAIVETAQGETMTLTDSSDKLFEGLRVFGKSTQDGTPSVENPVPIVNAGESGSITVEVTGRNLIDYTKAEGDADIQFVDGGFIVGGDVLHRIINIPYKFKKGESYTVTYKDKFLLGSGNIGIYLPGGKYSVSGSAPIQYGIFLNKPFVPQDEYTAIGFYVDKDAATNLKVEITDICLVKTGMDTDYEPYTHQPITLATPNGLPGIPVTKDGNYTDASGQQWVCDEIDLGREKYVQRVLKTKPNKTIVFTKQYDNGRCESFIRAFNVRWANGDTPSLSTIAPWSKWAVESEKTLTLNADGIYYRDSTKTLEEINAIFAKLGTNIEFCGVLATPIERDLTPEELAAYKALHTNYPTTVITNDAGAHMEASYVPDTGTYIRNMEERLNAKLVNIQSALISQKISGGGIKVTDSSRVPVVRFAMWGKTEQRRTTGKNLIDINSLKKYEVDNRDIKASIDNDKVILEGKGTKTSEVVFFCLNKTDDLLKLNPGKYTISFKSNMPMGTANESKTVEIFAIIKKADGSNAYSSTGNKGWATFDIAEGDMMYLRFDINNGTMSAEFYDIQLEYGSSATAYEPYSGGFPSPSPDYPQPIETTDQPVTVTIKGGTEQQSITLIPPKPLTKWDKLEKVDGVCCWVYQSKHILSYSAESITGEYFSTTGELSAGAEVYYKASALELIPLSPSEQDKLNALTMYAGTTEVTNTGGCNMELTYTVDTKSYVDSKIAAISAAVLEV